MPVPLTGSSPWFLDPWRALSALRVCSSLCLTHDTCLFSQFLCNAFSIWFWNTAGKILMGKRTVFTKGRFGKNNFILRKNNSHRAQKSCGNSCWTEPTHITPRAGEHRTAATCQWQNQSTVIYRNISQTEQLIPSSVPEDTTCTETKQIFPWRPHQVWYLKSHSSYTVLCFWK